MPDPRVTPLRHFARSPLGSLPSGATPVTPEDAAEMVEHVIETLEIPAEDLEFEQREHGWREWRFLHKRIPVYVSIEQVKSEPPFWRLVVTVPIIRRADTEVWNSEFMESLLSSNCYFTMCARYGVDGSCMLAQAEHLLLGLDEADIGAAIMSCAMAATMVYLASEDGHHPFSRPTSVPVDGLPEIPLLPKQMEQIRQFFSKCDLDLRKLFRAMIVEWHHSGHGVDIHRRGIDLKAVINSRLVTVMSLKETQEREKAVTLKSGILTRSGCYDPQAIASYNRRVEEILTGSIQVATRGQSVRGTPMVARANMLIGELLVLLRSGGQIALRLDESPRTESSSEEPRASGSRPKAHRGKGKRKK